MFLFFINASQVTVTGKRLYHLCRKGYASKEYYKLFYRLSKASELEISPDQ